MANEQAGGLNQDPNVRAQYQLVLQELMLFFQNNQQLNHHNILNDTDYNLLGKDAADQATELE